MSDPSIKRGHLSKHHVKLGVVNPIIGLDVPSGNSTINSKMVEMAPISNTKPQVLHHFDRNEGSFSRSHEWDKLIVDKKSIMELILSQCDETTREEVTLGQSPGYDVMTGRFLEFIKQLRKVCTPSRDKNVFFGSTILSMITKQHVRPPSKSKNVFSDQAYLSSLNTTSGQQQEPRNYLTHTLTMITCGRTPTYVTYLLMILVNQKNQSTQQ